MHIPQRPQSTENCGSQQLEVIFLAIIQVQGMKRGCCAGPSFCILCDFQGLKV